MRGVVERNRWRPSVFLTWQTHLWWQHLPILTTHTQTCTHTHTVIFICSKSSLLLHQDVWDVQTMSQKHSHNRKHALANRAGEKKINTRLSVTAHFSSCVFSRNPINPAGGFPCKFESIKNCSKHEKERIYLATSAANSICGSYSNDSLWTVEALAHSCTGTNTNKWWNMHASECSYLCGVCVYRQSAQQAFFLSSSFICSFCLLCGFS